MTTPTLIQLAIIGSTAFAAAIAWLAYEVWTAPLIEDEPIELGRELTVEELERIYGGDL